jgi:hypothetical protein
MLRTLWRAVLEEWVRIGTPWAEKKDDSLDLGERTLKLGSSRGEGSLNTVKGTSNLIDEASSLLSDGLGLLVGEVESANGEGLGQTAEGALEAVKLTGDLAEDPSDSRGVNATASEGTQEAAEGSTGTAEDGEEGVEGTKPSKRRGGGSGGGRSRSRSRRCGCGGRGCGCGISGNIVALDDGRGGEDGGSHGGEESDGGELHC